MSRFRKIDVRIHGDQKFRNLSAPCPCGRYLWFYLLTGPHTTSIPGLSCVGEAALAEALRWPMKGFREAFQEVYREGMAEADWEARVLWIPRAIFYNVPESPNVIKSWAVYWDEIPECELKVKAYQHFKGFLEGFGEAFHESFGKACGKPFGKALANQEQEQEQEQEQKTPPSPPGGEVPIPECLNTPAFVAVWAQYQQHRKELKRPLTPTATGALLAKLARWGEEKAIQAVRDSIAHGWRGIFEPEPSRNGTPPPTEEEMHAEVLRQRAERQAKYGPRD